MQSTPSKRISIEFWGVRGSIASHSKANQKYGGHTACVLIRYGGETIVCDGGTGIRRLGKVLVKEKRPLALLLTHLHWDHIFGLPFFLPLYQRGRKILIAGPSDRHRSLKSYLTEVMSPPFFPITPSHWKADITWKKLTAGSFALGKIRVDVGWVDHHFGAFAFQFFFPNGKRVIYVTDHELSLKNKSFAKWVHGADLLLHDSHFSRKEYATRKGWGHSAYEDVLELALREKVKRLFFFHHNPEATDTLLEKRLLQCRKIIRRRKSSLRLELSREETKVTI